MSPPAVIDLVKVLAVPPGFYAGDAFKSGFAGVGRLALQRTVGNAAVGRLLHDLKSIKSREPHLSSAGGDTARVIQRMKAYRFVTPANGGATFVPRNPVPRNLTIEQRCWRAK